MISIIVAMDKNRLIGGENKLLWNIPSELKRFKEITTGHPIIMGRKTHQSIGRVLPSRTNIVISHSLSHERRGLAGLIVVGSLDEIYAQAIPLADRLYLTIVEGEYEGDTYFPDYSAFVKVVEEKYFNEAGIKYNTLILEK